MNTIDYGREPGMIPAPMITREYPNVEAVEKVIVIETDEWKAYYRLSHIRGMIEKGKETATATYYVDDVEAK